MSDGTWRRRQEWRTWHKHVCKPPMWGPHDPAGLILLNYSRQS